MVFNRLKVRTRVFAGFGLLVVLSAALSVFTLTELDAITSRVTVMNALQANLTRVSQSDHDFETIRRALTRYRIDQDEQSAKEARDASVEISSLLVAAAGATLSDERRRLYNSLTDGLRTHDSEVKQFVDQFRAAAELRAKLFTGGDTLSAATNEMVAAAQATGTPAQIQLVSRAESGVLLVRVANWRFIATLDPNGPATFAANRAKAEAAIAAFEQGAPEFREKLAPVRAALADYGEKFNGYAKLALDAMALYEQQIRPGIKSMQGDLHRADQAINQNFNESVASSTAILSSTFTWQTGLATAAAVLGIALALIIGRGITGPLGRMTSAMSRLADGDRSIEVPARDNVDEIGDMARAVEVFKQNAITADRLAAEQEAARAARSRRQDAMDQHTQEFAGTIGGVMSSLASSAAGMRQASDAMSSAARAVHDQANGTSQDAEKSSRDLTAVAAAVEELTSTVAEISRQVTTASDIARQAVQRAEASSGTMESLSLAASRIGDVVHMISDIAAQTNLLALNATIEAARAGEAGKGFAVVAGEVKALASQTAKATAEISGQIETMRGATEQAVTAMSEISGVVRRMDEVSVAISAAVEEQSVTTREIATSVQAVSEATAQTAHAMKHVVGVADAAGTAASDVEAGSTEIGAQSETLRMKVDQFLEAVRSDSGERRQSERLSGNGVSATIKAPGRPAIRAAVRDMSRTGVALMASQSFPIGTEVDVELPDAGGPLSAVVSRCQDGVIGLRLHESAASAARIERALQAVGGGFRAAA